MKRCTECGSYAFNLYKEGIDQGDLCDVHYWKGQALTKQEQGEPVAMQMDVIVVNLVREGINKHRARELAEHFIKHTTPQPAQKPWVGLTDEEVADLGRHELWIKQFIRTIEAKLKEKNNAN